MKLIPLGKSITGFPIFIFLFLGAYTVLGQSWEVGLGLGGTTYTGDLVRTYRFSDNRPAVTALIRYNLNNVVSVKGSGLVGILQASDENDPIDPAAEIRDASFDRLMLETAVTLEYHFLDYKSERALINWSPYLFGGVGLSAYTDKQEATADKYRRIQPVIPFGVGLKYLIDPNWSLSAEFGARKTFFDYIDEISEGDQIRKNFQFGNGFDNDWYYFLGFTISYTFYKIPCPYDPN